jgi:PTH1 family peptidyl-tRNA hydrolase
VRLVVGLGNPGREYERSRHNVGFDVVDLLAEKRRIGFRRSWRARALVARMAMGGEDLLLVKPQTFMNRSGAAVKALLARYGLTAADVIVVVDDADLDAGRLRVRAKGSAGNHNGLKSMVAELGTTAFTRIRVGVGGKPEEGDMVAHVLSPVTPEERVEIDRAVARAAEAVAVIASRGVTAAMNMFNG